MIFITLTKWKQAPTKEIIEKATKTFEDMEKQGIKMKEKTKQQYLLLPQ